MPPSVRIGPGAIAFTRIPFGAVVEGRRLRQADDAVLGGTVGAHPGRPREPGGGAHVDDRPARSELRKLGPETEEDAAQVDIERSLERRRIDRGQGRRSVSGARIVEGHDAEYVADADVVVYSSAIHTNDNPETLAAMRRKIPLRRATLMRTAEIYAERFGDADGRIPATFEIVWLSGWTPHESQQKPLRPGSATVR